MLKLSNVKVDIQGSRILNGISLSVAAGEPCVPCRSQWSR